MRFSWIKLAAAAVVVFLIWRDPAGVALWLKTTAHDISVFLSSL